MNNDRLLHYQITGRLGQGGMGEVYRATDSKLGREVAIKVLPGSINADPQALARFEREARSLAALNHPHIAAIYGFEADRDTHFLVLELIEGETLAERLQRGPLPIREALAIARDMAEAIREAHEKGIIHRDLKPGNVKITPRGRVKVLDFGLAKGLDLARGRSEESAVASNSQVPTLSSERTAVGTVLGTPAYMSPEQTRGQPVDQRTDVWAFGCCLYECLTGLKAFRGPTATDVVAEVLKGEPDWSQIPPGTPAGVVTLVRRCLEKDVARRLSNMGDIAITLEETAQLLSTGSSSATPSPPQTEIKAGRPLMSRGWGIAAAAIVLLAAMTGIFWWRGVLGTREKGAASLPPLRSQTGQPAAAHEERRIRSLAVRPLDDYSQDTNNASLSDGMTEALCAALGNISALEVRGHSSVVRYKGSNKTIREMAKELEVDGIVEGSVQHATNRLLIRIDLVDAATDRQIWATNFLRDVSDFFNVQNEVAQAIAAEVQVRLSPRDAARLAQGPSVNPVVLEPYLQGRFHLRRGTKTGFEQALVSFNQAIQLDPNFAKAYSGIADAYWMAMGWWVEDPVGLTRGLEAATKAVALDPASAEGYNSLGVFYTLSWRWGEAEKAYEAALRLNPRYALAYSGFGWHCLYRGRNEEGLKLLLREQELEPGNPLAATDVAWAAVQLGRYELAATSLDKALSLDPNYWLAQGWRGMLKAYQGDYAGAILWAEKALQTSDGNSEMLGNLGWIYGQAGQTAKARSVLDQLRTMTKPRTAAPWILSWVYIGLKQPDEAILQLQKGLSIHDTGLMFLKFDRRVDPIRSDPRLKEIVRAVGLDG
jgi:serine/threonine protein kinase/tetratricopeptide (TPR) repeat protein